MRRAPESRSCWGRWGCCLATRTSGAALRDTQRNCVIEGVFDIAAYGLRRLFRRPTTWTTPTKPSLRRILNSCRQEPRLHQRPAGAARTAARVRQPAHRHPFAASEPDPRLGGVPHRSARYRGRQRRAAGGVSRQIRAVCRSCSRTCARLRAEADAARRDEEWLRYQAEELTACAPACGRSRRTGSGTGRAGQCRSDRRGDHGRAQRLRRGRNRGAGAGQERRGGDRTAGRESSPRRRLVPTAAFGARRAQRHRRDARRGRRARSTTNPERLQKVDDRLNTLDSLCQKHRAADEGEADRAQRPLCRTARRHYALRRGTGRLANRDRSRPQRGRIAGLRVAPHARAGSSGLCRADRRHARAAGNARRTVSRRPSSTAVR